MKSFEELKAVVAEMEEDMSKFTEKGNKVAGTRCRKSLQTIKKLAQAARIEIQETKNS